MAGFFVAICSNFQRVGTRGIQALLWIRRGICTLRLWSPCSLAASLYVV